MNVFVYSILLCALIVLQSISYSAKQNKKPEETKPLTKPKKTESKTSNREFSFHNTSIFETTFYCSLVCRTAKHTLCDPYNSDGHAKHCRKFKLHSFSQYRYRKFREELVNGHNGIRDSVAMRMNIPNMLELIWDWELSRMADAYLKLCFPFSDDVCAKLTKFSQPHDQFEKFYYRDKDSYKFIVQNRVFFRKERFPPSFISDTLLLWYNEKNHMNRPRKVTLDETDFSRLLGNNNFTHMTFPLAYRFGCSFANMFGGFVVICFYYPFFISKGSQIFYVIGEPSSQCPSAFPIKHLVYSNLCSAFYSGTSRCTQLNFLLIVLVVGTTLWQVL